MHQSTSILMVVLLAAVQFFLLQSAVTVALMQHERASPPPHEPAHYSLQDTAAHYVFLVNVSDWIMTLDLRSNVLKGVSGLNDSIFINGNLARSLMAAYKLTGNETYLDEALAWCDTFCDLQHTIETSKGGVGGYWGTGYGPYAGHGDVYLADTGTAVQALAVGYHLADSDRQQRYLKVLNLYDRFVQEGCKEPPPGRGPTGSPGWVIDSGPNSGGMGDGYYEGKLDITPYTISTDTTAAAFYAELYRIQGKEDAFAGISARAVDFLLKLRRADGSIPYLLAGTVDPSKVYQPISYSAEGFIAAALHVSNGAPYNVTHMLEALNSTVAYLIQHQNEDGSWGAVSNGVYSGDSQRAARAASLIQWYLSEVDPSDTAAQQAMMRFMKFLMTPAKAWAYGVNSVPLPTGFAALAVADHMQPWCSFGPPL